MDPPTDVANFYLAFIDNPIANKRKATLTDDEINRLGKDIIKSEEGVFYKQYYIGRYKTLKKWNTILTG